MLELKRSIHYVWDARKMYLMHEVVTAGQHLLPHMCTSADRSECMRQADRFTLRQAAALEIPHPAASGWRTYSQLLTLPSGSGMNGCVSSCRHSPSTMNLYWWYLQATCVCWCMCQITRRRNAVHNADRRVFCMTGAPVYTCTWCIQRAYQSAQTGCSCMRESELQLTLEASAPALQRGQGFGRLAASEPSRPSG